MEHKRSPSVADDLNPAELITSVLADIADERTDDASSTLRSLLSLSLARATAFRPDRPSPTPRCTTSRPN